MFNPARTANLAADLTAINQYLSRSNGHEKHITRKLNLHKRVLAAVQRALPEFLASQCIACVVNQRKLNVYTASPVWASRLRYHKALILKSVNASNPTSIDRVDIRILIAEPTASRPASRANAVSGETVKLLASLAQSTEHAPLKQSLLRLAESLEKRL